MRGWGIKAQIGMSYVWVQAWPFDWRVSRSLMAPRLYGFGIWLTHDRWAA